MGTLAALRFFHSLIGGKQNDLNEEEDEKVSGTIHAPFFEPQFCGKMNDDGTLTAT